MLYCNWCVLYLIGFRTHGFLNQSDVKLKSHCDLVTCLFLYFVLKLCVYCSEVGMVCCVVFVNFGGPGDY